MEVHTVHDTEPFPGWDSGAGLQEGEKGEDINQKGLKGQRILSRGMTQSNEVQNDTSACCGTER